MRGASAKSQSITFFKPSLREAFKRLVNFGVFFGYFLEGVVVIGKKIFTFYMFWSI